MRTTTISIILASFFLESAMSRRFTAHHANLLLRTNPSLHCNALQCIHGTCVNFGVLVSKGNEELCICKYGFHGDHCEFQASTDTLNGKFGNCENFGSIIGSITVMFVMISIIFLAGGFFIGKMTGRNDSKKIIQTENQLRVPRISRPVSKSPSTSNLVGNNLLGSSLGISQSKLTSGLRAAHSANSIHRRSFSEGAGLLLSDNENVVEKVDLLSAKSNSLKVPGVR